MLHSVPQGLSCKHFNLLSKQPTKHQRQTLSGFYDSFLLASQLKLEIFGLNSDMYLALYFSWHSAQTTHKAPLETLRGFETRGS